MMRSFSQEPKLGKPIAQKIPGIQKVKVRPRMRSTSRHCWSECTITDIDGTEMNGYYETQWGAWFYFVRVGEDESRQWYRGRIDEFPENGTITIEPDLRRYKPR